MEGLLVFGVIILLVVLYIAIAKWDEKVQLKKQRQEKLAKCMTEMCNFTIRDTVGRVFFQQVARELAKYLTEANRTKEVSLTPIQIRLIHEIAQKDSITNADETLEFMYELNDTEKKTLKELAVEHGLEELIMETLALSTQLQQNGVKL